MRFDHLQSDFSEFELFHPVQRYGILTSLLLRIMSERETESRTSLRCVPETDIKSYEEIISATLRDFNALIASLRVIESGAETILWTLIDSRREIRSATVRVLFVRTVSVRDIESRTSLIFPLMSATASFRVIKSDSVKVLFLRIVSTGR